MGIWSSIREFYRRRKPEIDLYGIGFLLMGSALVTGRYAAAGVVFAIMILLDVMRRWGEPYRKLGEKEWARRQEVSQAYWREHFTAIRQRLQGDADVDEPSQTTNIIPAPTPSTYLGIDDEPPPESPAPLQDSSKPTPPSPPSVTHDT